MILLTESEEAIWLLLESHVLTVRIKRENTENYNKMAYGVIMFYHLHMPSYFLGDIY